MLFGTGLRPRLPLELAQVDKGYGNDSVPFDYKRPTLGCPQNGGGSPARRHDRTRGGGHFDRHPKHTPEGNLIQEPKGTKCHKAASSAL